MFIIRYISVFLVFFISGNILALSIEVQSNPVSALVYGDKLFVANADSASVSVIDIKNKTTLGTLPVGFEPNSLAGIGQNIYVGNNKSSTVYAIDSVSFQMLYSLNIPHQINTLESSGVFVYVIGGDTITVIDTKNKKIKSTVRLQGSYGTSYPTHYPLGKKIFVHHPQNPFITIINTEQGTVSTSKTSFSALSSVIVGKTIYFVNQYDKRVEIYHVDTLKPILQEKVYTPIPTGNTPSQIVYLQGKLYVNNISDNTVTIIDEKEKKVIKTLSVGAKPVQMFTVGGMTYTINQEDGTISLIDGTDRVIHVIKTGGSSSYSLWNNNVLYVLNTHFNSVQIYDNPVPNILSFSVDKPNGKYDVGSSFTIKAVSDTPLQKDSHMTVKLNTGRSILLDQISDKTLSSQYTIGPSESATALDILSIDSSLFLTTSGIPAIQYTFPADKNISKTRTIEISGSPINPVVDKNMCSKGSLYRLCPSTLTPTSEEKREELVCEGIINPTRTSDRFISHFEVLDMAVRLSRKPISPASSYKDSFTDIVLSPQTISVVRIVQTALDHKLFFVRGKKFGKDEPVRRHQVYSYFMKSVCIPFPVTSGSYTKQTYQAAHDAGLFTKSWRKFRPNSKMNREDVYALAYNIVLWADKNGGCDVLMCRAR